MESMINCCLLKAPPGAWHRDYRWHPFAVGRSFARGLFAVMVAVVVVASFSVMEGALAAERLATILVYHRFGEDNIPSTNTPLADFEAHLEFLRAGDFSVISLERLVAALESGGENGGDLPPRAVVITIDDAYRSSYSQAWPRLRELGFPFTLFVASEPVESAGGRGYLSWDEIAEMSADPLVTIGHHSHSHGHMTNFSAPARAADFGRASAIFARELGFVPEFFAHPYGEYTRDWSKALADLGVRASLAQHSGSVGRTSPLQALPRFAMSGSHTSVERLGLAVRVEPILVHDFIPGDPVLSAFENPPRIRFVVDALEGSLDGFACYLGGGRVAHQVTGREVEIRLEGALPLGRNRLNCTLPPGGGRDGGVWGWLGVLLYYPGNDD